LRDSYEICNVYSAHMVALANKIWMDLLKGLRSYGSFNLKRSGSPKFSAPLAAKLYVGAPTVLEVQARARGPLS